jgi:hypothetical protein
MASGLELRGWLRGIAVAAMLACTPAAGDRGIAEDAVPPIYEELATSGRKMFKLWRCAAYASAAGLPNAEVIRLFNKGLDLGRPLVKAIFDGRVMPRGDKLPFGLLGCGNGPTAEFVLGRMFQCAMDSIDTTLQWVDDKDERAAWAKQSYDKDKCAAE